MSQRRRKPTTVGGRVGDVVEVFLGVSPAVLAALLATSLVGNVGQLAAVMWLATR